MFSSRLALALGLAFTLGATSQSSVSAQSDIPGVGSWKMNVSKSKLGKEPTPQSITSTIKAVGQGAKMTGVCVAANGLRRESEFTANFDGKDYPITGTAHADTVSLKRIDARTVERTDKKQGRVVETSTTVYSEDGKISTTTGKARNMHGEEFRFVVVHEKQDRAN
jgi:phage tail sheath gpL-like